MFLCALLAACSVVRSAPAVYPITPQPLRVLVHDSEFIVTAWVRESAPSNQAKAPVRQVPWDHEVVALEVESLVKGDPGVRFIEQTNDHWICPAPAWYDPGTRVLAFLARESDGPGFTTPALSYGSKTLDDADLAVYLDRIREQLAIEEMPDDALRLQAQVEWLVVCAEHPATRWEGAYELEDPSYDCEPAPGFGAHLTEAQRHRLRDAFLEAEGFGAGEQCLEALFRDDRDPRLLAWLVAQLRKQHEEVEEHPFGEAAALVEAIARRDGRPEVRQLGDAFGQKQMSYCDGERDGPGFLAIARELLGYY